MHRTLCSKLFVRRAWRYIYTCTTGMFSRTLYAWNPVSLTNFPSLASSRQRYFIFDPDANSVLLRAHLCTAVDSMRREPWVQNWSRERKIKVRTLYAQHPVSLRIFPSIPGSRLRFLSPGESSTAQCTVFYTLQPKSMHPAD